MTMMSMRGEKMREDRNLRSQDEDYGYPYITVRADDAPGMTRGPSMASFERHGAP